MALVADGIQGVDSAPTSMAKGCKNNSLRLNNKEHKKPALETALSFQNLVQDLKKSGFDEANIYRLVRAASLPHPALIFTPRPVCNLNEAATKLQKVYRSYRTRRNLADCAVVVEELWWKALDFATLNRSSVSFFDVKKPETAVSRWTRARTKAAKVGKGLSKDENAQKLALQHWLEAIDPRHRYGHNLHLYYDVWSKSESAQPFFYWLDVGDGKEVNLDKCPRLELHCQCIKYLGPKERISFEVVIEDGKLVYKESGKLVDTSEDTKWIFVLSTIRTLYVGQKQKGLFQHSSFLAGGAITAAGRLIAREGVLEAIWPYSGHYHPTEENFKEFLSFLGEHSIDLANVKMRAADDDCPPSTHNDYETDTGNTKSSKKSEESSMAWALDGSDNGNDGSMSEHDHPASRDKTGYRVAKRMSRKWSTGAGPRIGCVRDYPPLLQFEALKQLKLSPKTTTCSGVPASSSSNYDPIPSPRPSPKLRLSPSIRIRYMAAQRSPVPNLPENFR